MSLFAALGAIEQAHVRDQLRAVMLPQGYKVFESGNACHSYVLIRSGRVRVHQLDENGREVVLYRLGPGESCILNTAALLAGEPYAASAVAETDVDALTLSVAHFDALVKRVPRIFRSFVFREHAERLAHLMRVIRDVAFTRIDIRLARRLLELSRGKDRPRHHSRRAGGRAGAPRGRWSAASSRPSKGTAGSTFTRVRSPSGCPMRSSRLPGSLIVAGADALDLIAYAALWVSFALGHSLLASNRVRRASIRLGGSAERLLYNLVAVLHLALVLLVGRALLATARPFPLRNGSTFC